MTFDDPRVKELILGRRSVRRLKFPGSDEIEIGVRVLSDHEIDNARIEAARYAKTRKADLSVDPEFLDREIERQLIWSAFVDPQDKEPEPARFFPSDAVVRSLDSVLVRQLLDIYLDHQETSSPKYSLSEEDAKKLVEALKKAQEPAVILAQYDARTLRLCVRTLVSMLPST